MSLLVRVCVATNADARLLNETSAPGNVVQYVVEEFTAVGNYDGRSKRWPQQQPASAEGLDGEVTGVRAMPVRLQDKLLLHLFALTLHVDRFQSELSPLPSDLRLNQHKCAPLKLLHCECFMQILSSSN